MKRNFFVVVLFWFSAVSVAKITSGPPDHKKLAEMARYIMKSVDWVSLATISTQQNVSGYPFVTLKSVSDGTRSNSTGIPYLYMTDIDLSGKDILTDNRVTIMSSLEQSNYCQQNDYDPQDPRCAKLMITGRMMKLNAKSKEYEFGYNALLFRHPQIKYWPKDHGFYVAKIYITQIAVLDFFGGVQYVSLDDYLNVGKRRNIFHDVFNRISLVTTNV